MLGAISSDQCTISARLVSVQLSFCCPKIRQEGATVQKISVAIIDSDTRMLNYMRQILADTQGNVATYNSGKQALQSLRSSSHPKQVLISSELNDLDYLEIIRQIRLLNSHIGIVLMAFPTQLKHVVAAVRAGAREVLLKPFQPQDLIKVVKHPEGETEILKESGEVEIQIDEGVCLVYASPGMRELQQQAALVARVNLPVLVLGESGTGKEVVARYIHSRSPQAKNVFLKINCAAVPSELLESELFGYEQGAFTGAGRSKPGKFKLCDGGTMFLDEIGEMHPSLQAKLLQVLQDGTFSPLGSRATEKVRVRIIAATNVDMAVAIAKKEFREDFYYRLNGFCIKLPPLRERREDIPVLLRHFLHRYSHELGCSDVQPSLSSLLIKTCLRYDWPGNLRELESFVKRFLVLGDEQLMVDELMRDIVDLQRDTEITAAAIVDALQSAGGNRRAAAKALGISYRVLLRRLRQFHPESSPNRVWIT
jgi:two-component system, NtrC family, response regulator AtoC